MAVPEGLVHFIPPGQEEIQKFISSAANQSVRPYSTNEEYLYAMKEDLAEWFKELYNVDIHVDNFIEFLKDGILLCEHANRVNEQAREFKENNRGDPMLKKIILPSRPVRYTPGRHASTFFALDNVASFINWCRRDLLIAEAVMFESNDLILRKNEKNFILCLLEVARRGSKFGVPAPVLIQMEEDIDREIELDLREEQSEEEYQEEEEVEPPEPPKQKVACDFKSLDEMVQYILGMCTCPTQFPMVKVSEGKYKVGDSRTLIFMRILRNHVMVRVGGGWDTLEHYLDKHDPCRCNRHRVEQKIASRFKCSTEEYFGKLLNQPVPVSSRTSQGVSVKQAADSMNKTAPTRNSETSRSREDWNGIKSQSLPGFAKEFSTPSSGRSSKVQTQTSGPGRTSRSSGRTSEAANRNNVVQSLNMETGVFTETDGRLAPQNTERVRSHSPVSSRGPKTYSLPRNSTYTKAPEIRITKTVAPLNQTQPTASRTSKTGNLRSSKTLSVPSENKTPPRSPSGRSKTPTPGSLRSSSTGSMSHYHEPRRSVTPTPTVTSQRRAELSQRAKSPDPDKMLHTSAENKRPTRTKGPPSSYRASETLPRSHRISESSPRREATLSVASPRTSSPDKKYNSLPRPSSAMSNRGMTETDSGKRSTLSASSTKAHHRSLQDVRQPPRPKSALGTYSTSSSLSTVPKTTSGRKTIATTSGENNAMQRLTSNARSRSMDNLSIQRQLNANSAENQRNQFFDRLSQPKSTPKNRARTNLVDQDVLFVERKGVGTGRHTVQRPGSPTTQSRTKDDRDRFTREGSTSSETSSHSAQPPITPTDLHLRLRRDEGEKKTYRGQGSIPSTPSPSRDSAVASSLRLSVSMTGSPESPTSRVSYSWTPDSGGDELDSPSSGQPIHTPKIINRHKQESHLKAPPKRKVSKEEVLHVVRNPDGRHQWEHTDTSLEQSQEYIELSPYKEQLSPRSSQTERQLRSSIRKASSSSDSSAISPGGPNASNRTVSKAQITLGKPPRSSTPNRLNVSAELRASNVRRKNDVVSTSSSSVASSKSSVDSNRTRRNITDQVRSMLFTEDGKKRPPDSSVCSPRVSTAYKSAMKQRPSTPKSDTLPRANQSRSQPRPTTPKSQPRSITPRPRPKTPESRRGTLTRQEKLKSYDGPNSKKEADPPPPPVDKETRMLREFEKELSENKKLLAASGESEDNKSGNESIDHRAPAEYDYNGRRIRKKPMRSKSPSNLRSKSAPRMDRLSSCDSELTNRSYDRADSMADSEDFEVAMAMSGGAKRSGPSTIRSRSVDDFLDERGPKPRADKHESRKSRIPTPVHFNTSGRKSATGVPYHDSNMSKSALRSNVEGVSTFEFVSTNHRRGQGSFDDTRDNREQLERGRGRPKDPDDRRNQVPQDYHRPQKENIQPSSDSARLPHAEEYTLENQECFKFGRYGNTKTKSPRKNTEVSPRNGLKNQTDYVDGRQQYYQPEDLTAGYVDSQYIQKGRMVNSNFNNNNNSQFIGQQIGQSEEPIPPPRKKGGYHRSNLHTSPADLLKPNQPANQMHQRQYERNGLQNERIQHVQDQVPSTRGQQQQFLGHHPQDRNDSGIEAGTDPDSPGSSSAMSIRSAINGDGSIGAKSGSTGGAIFSPGASQSWENQRSPKQSSYQAARSHAAGQQHGVLETPTGTKYYYVTPGNHNARTHTGYDAPRQNKQPVYQAGIGYQNQSKKDQQPARQQQSVGVSQPHQSPKPAFYQQANQYNQPRNQATGYQSPQRNGPQQYQNTTPSPYYNQPRNQAPGNYQYYGPNQSRLDSSGYSPMSPPSNTSSSAYSSATDSRRTSASTIEDSRSRHEPQHPPIYERGSTNPESTSTRISKRRNFNDFFTDNRKLKDSLKDLSMLYNENDPKNAPGNPFQLEDDPFMDDRAQRSKVERSRDSYGNAFTLSYEENNSNVSPNNKQMFPYASGGAPPQYGTPQSGPNKTVNPQGYYSSSTFPRSSRKDNNNNPTGSYPNMDAGQYPQDDTPPAPPPRHKTQYKAFERQKLDNSDPSYYAHLKNSAESTRQNPNARFQMSNGLDLRQASEKRVEEYV